MNNDIRWISLKNNGGFNVSIRVKGGSESYNGSSYPVGQERTVDLADAVGKIKDGDTVYLEAVVKGGKNRTASERFTYRKSSNQKARYSIKGGTLTAKLSYNGLEECFTKISEPIRWISLKNNGAFSVSIRVNGGSASFNSSSFPIKQERTVDLADAVGKIKDGDEVWLEAVVHGGNNYIAKQHFIYRKASNKKACYTIKGTTLDNSLSYNGFSEQYTKIAEPIRWISLKNNGAFTVSIRVKGGSASFNSSSFPVGQEREVDLAAAVGKIKEGDEVWLEAVVNAGDNNTAKQHFIYRKASKKKACYTIKGTTLDNSLSYNGISDQYTMIAEPIRGISLKNNGGFVAQIRVKGESISYNVGTDICVRQEQTIDLAEAVGKIKDGDEVWLEAVVKGGYNNTAKQHFIYRKSSNYRACYTINGTTLNNSMPYNGIEQYFIRMSDPIRCISLKNDGGFVARITVKGGSGSYNVSQDICVAQEKRIDLADAVGIIKDGDEVWLEAVVRGGANKTARQRFVYRRSSDNKACYTINGTTQINTLSYNGTFKVGVVPSTPATYNGIISKINDWEKKRTACAWPGIEKSEIIEGLKAIADYYFKETSRYTQCRDLKGGDSSNIYSGIYQGDNYPICGPVAVMFYLAKLNISTFVDTVTTLYETGSLMGYSVPYSLRKIEKDDNQIEEKYNCHPKILANVCWMFQSSIAQKETILDIKLDPEAIKMHTRHDEMEDDINFVFNTSNLRHQLLAAWSTVNKSLNNLNEWMNCLNNSGSVFWMIHGTAIKNIIYGENNNYNHADLVMIKDGKLTIDLHWVVVSNVQKTSKDVILDLHTWGKLYRITVPHAEFQRMTYLALLFNVK